ncbi:helix-turn-helix domain-containing protein [Nonomuraea recticatena]|uniref:helix-turn-helix domain-containing protein n=1 Tax=Nonomuraea recticatena TaxID=46178 RepID=UPI00361F8677
MRGSCWPAPSPGASNAQVARELGITVTTVSRWRAAFAQCGMDALRDRPWTGRPKAELTVTAQERATLQRWSRRAKSSQAMPLLDTVASGSGGPKSSQPSRSCCHRSASGMVCFGQVTKVLQIIGDVSATHHDGAGRLHTAGGSVSDRRAEFRILGPLEVEMGAEACRCRRVSSVFCSLGSCCVPTTWCPLPS